MKDESRSRTKTLLCGLVVPVVATLALCGPAVGQAPKAQPTPVAGEQSFPSPEEAVSALTSAVAAGDRDALGKMFGPALDEIASGDPVADKAALEHFSKRLKKMTNLVRKGDSNVILYLGAENWPFPFPIVKNGDSWHFDGEAGIREITDRRVGENELMTIRACREYGRVQREYESADRDGDQVLEYAQHVKSTSGTKDGLYWATDGGDESPLGPFFATASAEGYTFKNAEPEPFHGYLFKILKRQGASAAGGAYNYVINGNMIGGFALLAYPAKYGSSGLMSFILNQQGEVYQKDLGPNTATVAAGMEVYDPNPSWTPVDDN